MSPELSYEPSLLGLPIAKYGNCPDTHAIGTPPKNRRSNRINLAAVSVAVHLRQSCKNNSRSFVNRRGLHNTESKYTNTNKPINFRRPFVCKRKNAREYFRKLGEIYIKLELWSEEKIVDDFSYNGHSNIALGPFHRIHSVNVF